MKKYVETFLLAAGAGIAIAIGGTVYLSMENRILGAFLFTVGLYLIVTSGLNLYTGKIGYLPEQGRGYLSFLLVVWLGNMAGTFLGAQALLHTRIGKIAEDAAGICQGKLSDSPGSMFLLGIFCGILMYGAVDGYKKTKNSLILFLCVGVFILSGFEHCVANMFYFSLANAWSPKAFLYLVIVTLGNSAGGMLFPLLHIGGFEKKGENEK